MEQEVDIKSLDLEGLKTLVEWARAEGWDPGGYDAEAFWKTDPDGFVGCFIQGELIGGGSIVSYNGRFGFMGFFIMRPEYRGKGLGRKLWYARRDKLSERLDEGASIGMDGVLAMQPFYAEGGFEIAFRDERHKTVGQEFEVHEAIDELTETDFPDLLAYDRKCFGFDRETFLRAWMAMPNLRTFVYKLAGELKGFAMVRSTQNGFKICPLFADDIVVAEELYKACANACRGSDLFLDIPMINANAVELMKQYNSEYVFECARMYYGPAPKQAIDKVYGITTFELG